VQTMELDILTQALRLHDRGLCVFPVSLTTKRPLVPWGGLEAEMPTREKVQRDFAYAAREHGQFGVGIAMGPVSNSILLDFDFAKHPESRVWYEANRHRFPRTWAEETGSGGLHLYFRWCAALDSKQTNTTSKLAKGVDTKGHGGYSKITPSPGYKWLIPPTLAPMAMCPQWLIDSLHTKEGRVIADAMKAPDWMLTKLENVDPADPVNGRTPTFCSAIGRLKAKGLSDVEVKGLLAPWAAKYDYPKLNSLVDDQFRRYPPRPEAASTITTTATTAETAENAEAFLADITPVKWLCDPFIAEQSIGFIAGLPESRKSWISD
jgi:hypothetical protein